MRHIRKSVFSDIIHLFKHFTNKRRVQLLVLLFFSLLSAFSEVAALGVVLPFLALILSPEQAFQNSYVQQLAGMVGITTPDGMLLPITIIFIAVSIIAGITRLVTLYATTRFSSAIGSELTTDAYRRTLHQPYLVHLSKNTAESISAIKGKMDAVVAGIILPSVTMISALILLVAIVVALLAIDPIVAGVSMLGFGGVYVSAAIISRGRIRSLGKVMAENQTQLFRSLQEGLNGIRDVLLSGAQQKYVSAYEKADRPQRRAGSEIVFWSQSTRYVVEAGAMVLIALLAYALAQRSGGAAAAIPTLGALALGGQRLLPALQQVFGSWSTIAGNSVYLSDVIAVLDQTAPDVFSASEASPFKSSIELQNISYRYGDGSPLVLRDVSFKIEKGRRIGLIGPTGGGKSTLADIIMGFLQPTEGQLLVDGVPIVGSNTSAWQKNVAHVPQSIYLVDGSFAENIAIGDAAAPMDLPQVRRAAEGAHISSFIETRGEYDGLTGENGSRLSGGQRQRIGIARALYKRAGVMVLDEATSALDTETEMSVMKSIEMLDRHLTLIIIAHRLSTLSLCDLIIKIEGGRITAAGTYADMVAS